MCCHVSAFGNIHLWDMQQANCPFQVCAAGTHPCVCLVSWPAVPSVSSRGRTQPWELMRACGVLCCEASRFGASLLHGAPKACFVCGAESTCAGCCRTLLKVQRAQKMACCGLHVCAPCCYVVSFLVDLWVSTCLLAVRGFGQPCALFGYTVCCFGVNFTCMHIGSCCASKQHACSPSSTAGREAVRAAERVAVLGTVLAGAWSSGAWP
jgi:hypothetical protein